MSKRVLLVARDAAPSRCFTRLKPVLEECGLDATVHVGDGKPLVIDNVTLGQSVAESDLVILGMSSSSELAQPEIAAGEAAQKAGKRFGFYGDVPGCWSRARVGAWFEGLAPNTVFYFGTSQVDAENARSVFQKAQLIGAGNPLREEMAFPRFSRAEIRRQLGVGDDMKVVLAPGGKFPAGNAASWAMVIDAIKQLGGSHFQLILAIHPGDSGPSNNLYVDLGKLAPCPVSLVFSNCQPNGSEIVTGADIVVDFGSSVGVEAAFQRIPVVTLGFEVLFRRHEIVTGGREVEVVTTGASELVTDAKELAEAMKRLFTPRGFEPMRQRQLAAYPVPKKRGAALQKMADAIQQMLSSR